MGISLRNRQARARRGVPGGAPDPVRPEAGRVGGARLALARWAAFDTHVRNRDDLAGAGMDLTLTQVILLVGTIVVPGVEAVLAGLDSVRSDLRMGLLPDDRLMAGIGRRLATAAELS